MDCRSEARCVGSLSAISCRWRISADGHGKCFKIGFVTIARVKLTFDESLGRPCALRFTDCGGPTASGLDGYVCENCLAFVVSRLNGDQIEGEQHCGYCGGGAAFAGVRGQPLCLDCAQRAPEAARSWYAFGAGGPDMQHPPPT